MDSLPQPSSEAVLTEAFCEEAALARPLCVDLDGTLITSDTLWESVLLLLRQRPWLSLLLPFWLLGGRARFKRAIARNARLDPATLPYHRELLAALRGSRRRGRKLVLATAADRAIADDVARHLALFDAVHASDGENNLKASKKRDLLRATYGDVGFDYVGDSAADKPILEVATKGYLVGASKRAARATRHLKQVTLVSPRPSWLRPLIRELRPHQWAKNALVILPALLAPSISGSRPLLAALLATAAFSLCASAGYVFNDLIDIEADRAHTTKYRRPFASGDLPVLVGPPLFVALLVVAFSLSLLFLPLGFCVMLGLYFVGTVSYSLYWKRLLMLDVLVLAGLYTHRILAGGIATQVPVSAWLLGFSMFFFTSLAFAKRYIELRALTHDSQIKNRGYFRHDLEMVTSMGTASGYIAALVFVLYVDSVAVRVIYREPKLLWLVLPVLLYWLGRIWMLAGRGQVQEDPVKFALKDRHSFLAGVIIFGIVLLARFAPSWLTGLLSAN
jgi:4-hydroxybenzoate polyprenyltransferase/phosphoserine phosphatase